MKSKKKIVLIVIAVIVLLLFISSFIRVYKKRKGTVDISSTVKEIVEYLGSTYIKTEFSKEKEYYKDIYISFSADPITKDGESSEKTYEQLIVSVSRKMKKKDFKIIDEGRGITVKVKSEANDTISYTINDDKNYFSNKYNEFQLNHKLKENEVDVKISSDILNQLIANNWDEKVIKNNSKMINKDDEYIYYNEGYKVKFVGSKVYNIVFTNTYKNALLSMNYNNKELVIDTEKENTSFDEEFLMSAPYYGYEANNMIGFKSKDLYFFKESKEVSIYPNRKMNEEQNVKFAKLFEEYSKDIDVNRLLDKATDINGNYAKYENSEDKVCLIYPIEGIEIDYNYEDRSGVYLYSNYEGNIIGNKTSENIKEEDLTSGVIHLNFNENLLRNYELNRMYDSSNT